MRRENTWNLIIRVMAVPKRSDRFFSSGFRMKSWRPVEKTFSYVFTNRDGTL